MLGQQNFNAEDFQEQVIRAVEIILYTDNLDRSGPRPYSSGFEESQREAEEIVQHPGVKELICSALQNIGNDVFEIANGLTPVLVGAILGGTLSIPLNPILFGWIALIVFRIGVATLCNNHE